MLLVGWDFVAGVVDVQVHRCNTITPYKAKHYGLFIIKRIATR